jgi:predicted DNA-binding mobile mystery protein A
MNAINDIVREGLDKRLPQLQKAKESAVRPTRGWLRAVREAIGAKQDAVAKRMGVKRQSYARLEATEAQGAISLNSLQKAADAMDCEVIYYLVPKPAVAANYIELAKRHDPTFKHLKAAEHSMALEDQAVGDLKPKP